MKDFVGPRVSVCVGSGCVEVGGEPFCLLCYVCVVLFFFSFGDPCETSRGCA